MTEVRRAVNTFYVLDGGYCVTEWIAKDKGKYFEAVLASDYDALAARVQAVEKERDELQGSVNRAGTYLGKDIAEKKQAEQQVARLRETLTKPLPR